MIPNLIALRSLGPNRCLAEFDSGTTAEFEVSERGGVHVATPTPNVYLTAEFNGTPADVAPITRAVIAFCQARADEVRFGIESVAPDHASCVVRCLAGTVRVGQVFSRLELPGGNVLPVSLALGEIVRYGRRVEFVDPPHIAQVRLVGDGADRLVPGALLSG